MSEIIALGSNDCNKLSPKYEMEMLLLLYRIFLVIKNKYIQSFIAIILSVLILSFEFATLLLYKSANITKNNIMREIGVTLNISPNDEYLYSLMEDEFNSLGQPDSYAFSGNGLLK